MSNGIRRPELHARAHCVASACCAKFGGAIPQDLLQVLQFWQSCELGLERAAQQLIAHATIFGVRDPADPSAPPQEER